MFDIFLLEKSGEDGLKASEIATAMSCMAEDNVYPVEFPANEHECSAMGFITVSAAEKMNFIYELVKQKTVAILDDMKFENADRRYVIELPDKEGSLYMFLSRNAEDARAER